MIDVYHQTPAVASSDQDLLVFPADPEVSPGPCVL